MIQICAFPLLSYARYTASEPQSWTASLRDLVCTANTHHQYQCQHPAQRITHLARTIKTFYTPFRLTGRTDFAECKLKLVMRVSTLNILHRIAQPFRRLKATESKGIVETQEKTTNPCPLRRRRQWWIIRVRTRSSWRRRSFSFWSRRLRRLWRMVPASIRLGSRKWGLRHT